MKPSSWAIVLALIIVGAGTRLLWFWVSSPAPGDVVPHRMPVSCSACGKAYVAMIGNEPTRCAFCKQPAAWRAQQCYAEGCGAIFPLIKDRNAAPEAGRRCAKCGSTRIGEVSADAVHEP